MNFTEQRQFNKLVKSLQRTDVEPVPDNFVASLLQRGFLIVEINLLDGADILSFYMGLATANDTTKFIQRWLQYAENAKFNIAAIDKLRDQFTTAFAVSNFVRVWVIMDKANDPNMVRQGFQLEYDVGKFDQVPELYTSKELFQKITATSEDIEALLQQLPADYYGKSLADRVAILEELIAWDVVYLLLDDQIRRLFPEYTSLPESSFIAQEISTRITALFIHNVEPTAIDLPAPTNDNADLAILLFSKDCYGMAHVMAYFNNLIEQLGGELEAPE